jgi:hypothetical protein
MHFQWNGLLVSLMGEEHVALRIHIWFLYSYAEFLGQRMLIFLTQGQL